MDIGRVCFVRTVYDNTPLSRSAHAPLTHRLRQPQCVSESVGQPLAERTVQVLLAIVSGGVVDASGCINCIA